MLVDYWWMSGGCPVDSGGLLVDVQWIAGGFLVDVQWIGGGLVVDSQLWWIADGLVVDWWWMLVYYGGEYLDNFITIQWLDNLNHLFDYGIESKIRLINSNSA